LGIKVDVLHSIFNIKATSHLAVIINHATADLGTGVFVEVNGLRFIITAQHNIEGADEDQIYINLGIPDQDFIFKKKNMWSDKNLDVALIELDKFESDIMRKGIEPFIFNVKQNGYERKTFNAHAITGYPKSNWHKIGNTILTHTFTIATQGFLPYENWPSLAKESFTSENFLMVSLLEPDGSYVLVNQDGKPGEGLNPYGMSGAPLWVFDIQTVNNKDVRYGLLGIQTGFLNERKEVLKITKINKILEAIENMYGIKIPIKEP
jgi:hypothetical protein